MQKSCFLGPTIFEIPQPNWTEDERNDQLLPAPQDLN